jgi:hypothetical protein
MFTGSSAAAFAAASAPLISSFGEGLTLWRDGDVVHWAYDEQTIVVALRFDGTVDATFVDRPRTDARGDEVQAVYDHGRTPYRLTPGGAKAMVADMMAFFSGSREPRFRFTGFR